MFKSKYLITLLILAAVAFLLKLALVTQREGNGSPPASNSSSNQLVAQIPPPRPTFNGAKRRISIARTLVETEAVAAAARSVMELSEENADPQRLEARRSEEQRLIDLREQTERAVSENAVK